MVRVLIAEDSLTARALLVEILTSDPQIEVVGQAANGVEAVEMTRKLRPDLVTMDIHMPRMDGLEATKEIMFSAPTPIVIVTGSLGAREVESSLFALRAGALDVLAKPPGPDSPAFAAEAAKLIASVKAMAQVKVIRHWKEGGLPRHSPKLSPHRGPVVAIATSTGGPAALHYLFKSLPRTFPAPILVVQHISSGFAQGLASWLNTVCDLNVKLAEHGESLLPHTVYLAPEDRHLGVGSPDKVAISDAAPIGGFRPSGTYLFRSVAKVFGPSVVGIILTGMGEDGVAGLKAVRQAGGRVLAQDESSSVVFGMPGAAIAAGVAEQVLPLDAIAARVLELVRDPGE